jgi:hypothetical protein
MPDWPSSPPGAVTAAAPPVLDANVTRFGTIDSSVVSPQPIVIQSGTFTPKASSVDAAISFDMQFLGSWGSNIVAALYVAPVGTTPIIPFNGAALTAGVQQIIIGNSPNISWAGRIFSLTAGATYNWVLTLSVVGYYTLFELPETMACITCSSALNGGPANNVGSYALYPLTRYPDYEDMIVVMNSATNLHILRLNNTLGYNQSLTTGPVGFPLVSGRSTGLSAVSPNGQRVAVANYALNTVSIYDISDPVRMAWPKLIATVPSITGPYCVCWNAASTIVYVGSYVSSGSGQWQAITGANGATPTAGSAFSFAASEGLTMTQLALTPDGLHLVASTFEGIAIITVSSNTITVTSAPYVYFTLAAGTAGNTLAYCINASGNVIEIAIPAGTLTTLNTGSANYESTTPMASPDGNAIFLPGTSATPTTLYQLGLSSLSGQTPGALYATWGAFQGPLSAPVLSNFGPSCLSPFCDFLCTSGQWFNLWPGGWAGIANTYDVGDVGVVRFSPSS